MPTKPDYEALLERRDAIDDGARFGYVRELEAIVRQQNETIGRLRHAVEKNSYKIAGSRRLLEESL